ncbi:MAG TPA: hypothetical protein VN112_10865 [Ensifer sp.]|nr:hypothetical protein [Ensifer sp.]
MAAPAPLPDMIADCGKCAGLCCAAFAFEKSDMFAIDKPVDEGCPNLKQDFSCRIHADRIELGFRGCTLFDCHGAGQRVTQDIFGGRTWRDDPAIAAPMFELFRKMLKIHDYLRLIIVLEALPLSAEEASAVAGFRAELVPEKGWDRHSLEAFEEMRVVTAFERFAVNLKASPAAKALQARFSGL